METNCNQSHESDDVGGSCREADDVSSTSAESERPDTTLRCMRRLKRSYAYHSMACYVWVLDSFLMGANDRALRERPGRSRKSLF